MLKRLILAVLVWMCVSGAAEARQRYFNYCQRGGQKVVTQGLQSAGRYQRTFQSCTLHVYLAGTNTLATLYSDNLTPASTPLANPFTAASDGFFFFYAGAGKYDVQETFTDTTVSPSVVIQLAWGDVLLCDPIGPNADADCVASTGPPGPTGPTGPAGPSVCTDLTQVTNLYVSTAGSDTTGAGTIGSPWRNVKKAFDAGVPGIVCGRYIIHLATTGTYTGGNLSGRIFAGGGTDYNSRDVFWPFSNDAGSPLDNTWPYSWVEVVGSTAAPDSYIINSSWTGSGGTVFALSGANLTLRGLSVQGATGYGVQAANYSFVNLAGVTGVNNQTHVMLNHNSKLYFDDSGTVDDAGINFFQCTNNNFAGTRCIEAQTGSTITNFPASGNLLTTNASVNCYKTGTGSFVNCIRLEMQSHIQMTGAMGADSTAGQFSLVLKDSWGEIEEITHDCGGATGPVINLVDSQLMTAAFTGSIWNISNCTNGVYLLGNSRLATAPTFTSVTNKFVGNGGDTIPDNQVSRETFLVIGSLVDTVTFSATPTFNMNVNGSIKKITLTSNVTSSTISNPRPGDEITFQICQDGFGAHTFAFPANVLGEGTIAATASTCNVQRFFYDAVATNWYALAAMVTAQ